MSIFSLQKVEITEINHHEKKLDGGDLSQQSGITPSNKKRHFIHQGNHVTVIEDENLSAALNCYPSTSQQNINYNSLERGTRRKLPQVPNGGSVNYSSNGGMMNGNSDLYTHSLPRKAKVHNSSAR